MKHKILYESPYEYGVFSSEDRRSGRFYDCNGQKLPSVTTILSGTKEGDFLKKWIDKVGKADDVSAEQDLLDYEPKAKPNSRLSCQLMVTDQIEGLVVNLPEKQV